MATELTTTKTPRLPDVRRPETLSRLPPWAQERSASLKKEPQPDLDGAHREMWVLPASLILSDRQRAEGSRAIANIDAAIGMTPLSDMAYAEETTVAVLKMTMVLPSREAGELSSEAKGEAYMAALDDVPAWAVKEAIRKWYRSEYGDKHDYRWQPGPSTLREVAMLEVYRVLATKRVLSNLIAARPRIEFTPEHQERMRAAVAKHLRVQKA